MSEITRILGDMEQDPGQGSEELYAALYQELRRLAQHKLSGEQPGQTLQATALVHEVYLKLVGAEAGWANRAHFFKAAAETMRRILIDRARERGAMKRGGGWRRLTIQGATLAADEACEGLLDLDEALTDLRGSYPVHAELVSLRFYSGLPLHEAAQVLDLPASTADRTWAFARAWLYRRLEKG